MSNETPGLHHVTAIVGDAQRTADFYVNTLGLRLVKQTVNHDDTGTYHLYFGDGVGSPGTNVTFFPWGESGRQGEFGAGQTQATAYNVPDGSLDYWEQRLADHGVETTREERFDRGARSASETASGDEPRAESVLTFTDPDGIGLELVASDAPTDAVPWSDSPVPEAHQLRGFFGVTLALDDVEPTARILRDVLGYERVVEADGRHRYRSGPGGPGSVVDLVEIDRSRGRMGVGTVHHVAFSVGDVEDHAAFQSAFRDHGLSPSEVIDRKYFQSTYTREPGGVLFEMATTGPGFTADEPVADLGSSLVLPEWLEDDREAIEARLPPFDPPTPE